MKALWYCTKPKKSYYNLQQFNKKNIYFCSACKFNALNGKIVCVSDYEVEEIKEIYCGGCLIQTKTMCHQELLGRSRLTDEEFDKYNPNYAIHIKNLEIFDKPKELSNFYKRTEKVNPDIICDFCTNYPFDKCKECRDNYVYLNLTKAPQNMCYVFDYLGNKYVLISVHPEWLCLILNGLKDVELRKKVLKEIRPCTL